MSLWFVGLINLVVGIFIGYLINKVDTKRRKKEQAFLIEEYLTNEKTIKQYEENQKKLKKILDEIDKN